LYAVDLLKPGIFLKYHPLYGVLTICETSELKTGNNRIHVNICTVSDFFVSFRWFILTDFKKSIP